MRNMRSQELTRLSAMCCSMLICSLYMVGSYQFQLYPSRYSIRSSAVINSLTTNLIRSSGDYAMRSSVLSMSVMASGAYTNLRNPISLTNDEGVLKEILLSGEGGKVIEVGDIVAAEYSAATVGEKKLVFAKGDKEQFIVKDGSTIKGWDIAVTSMKVGEKARFLLSPEYAYGEKGVGNIIPPKSSVEIEIKVLAWLGNQLRPESLFQKDLDIDPFISSTPESIQRDYEDMQLKKTTTYEGSIVDIYLRRLKNISFGFGGSGFFVSQSGEKAPWYLNPNLTFPAMVALVMAAFLTVFTNGGIKEKGQSKLDLEVAAVYDRNFMMDDSRDSRHNRSG